MAVRYGCTLWLYFKGNKMKVKWRELVWPHKVIGFKGVEEKITSVFRDYKISNEGVIKNPKGKIVKVHRSSRGKPYVSIRCAGQQSNRTLAILVLYAFEGPPPAFNCTVGYKDNDWFNNRADNLFWKDKVRGKIRYDIQTSYSSAEELANHHGIPVEMVIRIRNEPQEITQY